MFALALYKYFYLKNYYHYKQLYTQQPTDTSAHGHRQMLGGPDGFVAEEWSQGAILIMHPCGCLQCIFWRYVIYKSLYCVCFLSIYLSIYLFIYLSCIISLSYLLIYP